MGNGPSTSTGRQQQNPQPVRTQQPNAQPAGSLAQQQAASQNQQGGQSQYYSGQQSQQQPQNYPGPAQVSYQPPPAHRQQQQQPAPPPRPAPVTQEYRTTATIRNQVNLKKQTLAVTPLPSNPALLSISFAFDASAACRVTTFVVAREEPKANCNISLVASQRPAPAPRLAPPLGMRYEKGLDHKFPQGGDPDGHVIDTSLFAPKQLTDLVPGSETFPLIVRLEALTDKGRAEGRSLDDAPVGGETPRWVQSQTTYAKLARDDAGAWEVRVIKQKIWVNGEAYELQEIYGMEQNRSTVTGVAAGLAAGEDVEGNECVICMSSPRDTTALPCRHMCMCHGCASALKTQTNKCPICRNEIESLLHIKITKGTAVKPPTAATAAAAGAAV